MSDASVAGHGASPLDRPGHAHGDHEQCGRALGEHGHGDHEHAAGRGGHHHDHLGAADVVATGDGRRVLWISLALLLVAAAIQFTVVAFSGSVALFGDSVHNLADALTALPLLLAFRVALRPVTDRFTYGYGRAEDLAGVFVVLVIAFSAAVTAWEAVDRLLNPRPVEHLWAVGGAAIVGGLANEAAAQLRIRTGRRIGSAALVADGLHARTDALTSLAVLLGAAGVGLGWDAADPVIALGITVALLAVLREAIRHVAARIMDAVEPGLVDSARSLAAQTPGVLAVPDLRVRWIGHELRAEVAVEVDAAWSFERAHHVGHDVEARLRARLPRLTSAAVRVCPAGLADQSEGTGSR